LLASSKDRFRHRFAFSSLVQRPEEAEPDGHNRYRFVKFRFWAPGWVASRAEIVWVSKRESPPDFPLRLFNLTRPRKLLASIPTTTLRDLRDRALIATLTYSFARIGAALKMKVEDLRPRGAGWTVRLHEKGGKEHGIRL
jgi:integrase